MDNWFFNTRLARDLLGKRGKEIGTLCGNKCEILPQFVDTKNKFVSVFCVTYRKTDKRKPGLITAYNCQKVELTKWMK